MSDKVIYIYDNTTEDIIMLKTGGDTSQSDIETTTILEDARRVPEANSGGVVTNVQSIMGNGKTVYSGNPTTPPPPPF